MVRCLSLQLQLKKKEIAMLFTLRGTQILDKYGAKRAAEIARRTDPDIPFFERGRHVDQVVRAMVFELSSFDLRHALIELDDGDAILSAFRVLDAARTPPLSTDVIVDAVCVYLQTPHETEIAGKGILRAALKALLVPWVWRRSLYQGRIAKRNQEWLRRDLVTRILKGDRCLRARARAADGLFTQEEYDRLIRDIRVGTERAAA